MGVKYRREYQDIVEELGKALTELKGIHTFFEMQEEEWHSMKEDADQKAYMRTLADDIIYALGEDRRYPIGEGIVEYDEDKHILKVYQGSQVVIIHLV